MFKAYHYRYQYLDMVIKATTATPQGQNYSQSRALVNYELRLQSLMRRARKRAVNNLLEFIVLVILRDQMVCGYEILASIHTKFNVLLSPGTLYPILNNMASAGLIAKERITRKILLKLTPLGESLLKLWQSERDDFQSSLQGLLFNGSSRKAETEVRLSR